MPTALLALHETTTPVTEVLGYRYDRHGMTAARIMAGGREFWVEGDGLADREISGADYTVRIPMARNVDSLNVAAAAAVAFWELR